MSQDNIDKLYDLLTNEGVDVGGDINFFRDKMRHSENRKSVHSVLQQLGFNDVGDEQQFDSWVGSAYQSADNVQKKAAVTAQKVRDAGSMLYGAYNSGLATAAQAKAPTAPAPKPKPTVTQQAQQTVEASQRNTERMLNQQQYGARITNAEVEDNQQAMAAGKTPSVLRPEEVMQPTELESMNLAWDEQYKRNRSRENIIFARDIEPIIDQAMDEGEVALRQKLQEIYGSQNGAAMSVDDNAQIQNMARLNQAKAETVDADIIIDKVTKAMYDQYMPLLEEEGITEEEFYRRQNLIGNRINYFQQKMYDYLIEKNVPKDKALTIANMYRNSNFAVKLLTMDPYASKTQRQISTAAQQRAEQNVSGLTSAAVNVFGVMTDPTYALGGEILKPVATAALKGYSYYKAGKMVNAASKTFRAGKAAITADEAYNAARLSLGGRMTAGAIEQFGSWGVHGGLDYPLSTFEAGEDYSLKEHAKHFLVEGTKGASLGVFSTAGKAATATTKGVGKVAASGGMFLGEAGVFTMFDVAEAKMRGEELRPVDYGKMYLSQLSTLAGFKAGGLAKKVLHSMGVAVQLGNWKAAPAVFLRDFVAPDVVTRDGIVYDKIGNRMFTEHDYREMKEIGIDAKNLQEVYIATCIEKKNHEETEAGVVLNAYDKVLNSPGVSAALKSKFIYLMENIVTDRQPIVTDYKVEQTAEGDFALKTVGGAGELISVQYFPNKLSAEAASRQQNMERRAIVGKTASAVREIDEGVDKMNFYAVCKEAGFSPAAYADAAQKPASERSEYENNLIRRYWETHKKMYEEGRLKKYLEEENENVATLLDMLYNSDGLSDETVTLAANMVQDIQQRAEKMAAEDLYNDFLRGTYKDADAVAAFVAENLHKDRGVVVEVTLSDGRKGTLISGDINNPKDRLVVKLEEGDMIQTTSDPNNIGVHVDAEAGETVMTEEEAMDNYGRKRGIMELKDGDMVTLTEDNSPLTVDGEGRYGVRRGIVESVDKENGIITVAVCDDMGNPTGVSQRMDIETAQKAISTAEYGKCLYVRKPGQDTLYMVVELESGECVLCYLSGRTVDPTKTYTNMEELLADGYRADTDLREEQTGTGTVTTGTEAIGRQGDEATVAPRTAVDRIPMGPDGKRDYTKGTVEDVADAFTEKASGATTKEKRASARKIAAALLTKAEQTLAEEQKRAESAVAVTDDVDAMFEAENSKNERVEEARRVVEHWKSVLAEFDRRETDNDVKLADEAEASRAEAAKIMGPAEAPLEMDEEAFWNDMTQRIGVTLGSRQQTDGTSGEYAEATREIWMSNALRQGPSSAWRSVLGHETTHALKDNHGKGQGKLWETYVYFVKGAMGEEQFEGRVKQIMDLYNDYFDAHRDELVEKYGEFWRDKKMSREDAIEEVCSDWAGENIFEKDPARLKALVDRVAAHGASTKGFIEKTVSALKDIYERLKQRFGLGSKELADVEAAIKAWESMYEYAAATEKESKAPSEKSEGTVADIVNDKPADGRKRGYVMVNGVRYDRQGRIDAVEGNESRAIFGTRPEDAKTGRFALVELDDVQESHKSHGRNPLHFIPEAQPKDRTSGSSKAAAVDLSSPEKFDPALLTGDGVVYVEAAPVVNERGEVIQGNGRVMILREAFGNDASRERYIQYLKDNAERFGLKPEDIDKMKNPVLVNRLEVDDNEAIRLGQLDEKNMTSGGTERIKTANARKLAGDKMGTFVNRLMRDAGEDSSLAELVDKNGADALYYLMQIGAITPTQYETAVKDGKLTAEGKNDINDLLKEDLFAGAPEALKGQFEKLPAKVQRELVSALGGEITAKEGYGLMNEFRQSIQAYSELMGNEAFQRARTYDDAKKAIEMWKREGNMFDQMSNAERYSDTALDFAAMFKGDNQKTVQEYFRKYYSIANGTFGEQASMFSEYETGKTYSKAEALSGARRFKIGPVKKEMDDDIYKALPYRSKHLSETISDGLEMDLRNRETPDLSVLFVLAPPADLSATKEYIGTYRNPKALRRNGVLTDMFDAMKIFDDEQQFARAMKENHEVAKEFETAVRDYVDRQIVDKYGLRRPVSAEEDAMLAPVRQYYSAKQDIAWSKEHIEPHYSEYKDADGSWRDDVLKAVWKEADDVRKSPSSSEYIDFTTTMKNAHRIIESNEDVQRDYNAFVDVNKLMYSRIRNEEEKHAPYPFEQMADGTFYFGTFPKFKVEHPQNSLADEKNVVRVSTPTDKNLIAVHNISAKSLGKAIELGGFAMPSIAVTKAELGHEDFGDISLLFSKDTINPTDRRNVLWDRDSWTPTFPEVDKKLSEKVIDSVYQRLKELVPLDKRASRLDVDESNLKDTLRRWDWDAAAAFADNAAMKQAYLADMGKKVRIPMREKTYSRYSSSLLQKIIDLANETGIDLSNSRVFFEADENPEYKAVVDRVKDIVLDDRIERNSERIAANPKIEKLMRDNYDMSFSEFDNLVYFAYGMKRDMASNGGKIPQIVDEAALKEVLDNKIPSTNKKYREWITNLFDGIVEKEGIRNERDIFTPSGNRRSFEQTHDPVTLHNVVAAMMRESERGGKGFFGSNIFGASANKFSSIAEMKSQSDRLQRLDKEENSAIEKAFTEEFAEIAHHVTSDEIGDTFDFRQALTEAVAKTHNAKGIYKELHPYWKKFTMEDANKVEDIVTRIGKMAVDYFEAKPNRAVALNEVKAAVVPKGTDKALVTKLKQEGIKVVTYDKNVEGSRVEAVDKAAQKQNIKFKVDEETPIFVSNAAEAVKGIKQEKAPASQWLAMLEKNGGLKAGEDKWLGLRAWLGEQAVDALAGKRDKNITKDEILDYIAKNDIRIEEVKYGVLTDETQLPDKKKIEEFAKPFVDEYESLIKQGVHRFDAYDQMRKKYGDLDFLEAFEESEDGNTIYLAEDEDGFYTEGAMKFVNKRIGYNPIDVTRLEYTTEGLENKKEIALTVPTIEPYNESDDVHFGDAGGGRAVAWVRFGDATSANADGTVAKVLVIDEIQSKRHQDGREKGYANQQERDAAKKHFDEVREKILANHDGDFSAATEEELKEFNAASDRINKADDALDYGVPDAPFDKNWHELAMKRMLRYAAENGYDKVAWTTGKQQSDRYDLGKVVNKIFVYRATDPMTGEELKGQYDVSTYGYGDETISEASGRMDRSKMASIFGKEIAEKLADESDAHEKGWANLQSENGNLEIGGEGMKGFYDKMLPSFMSKYGKKWGAKVGEVELNLPNEADRKMWSVDVNAAMKADVMKGQRKFKIEPPKTEAEAEEANVRFKLVDDPVKIAELSKEKKVVVYRAMQKVDGKYYPPMAAVVDGEMKPIQMMAYEQSDERPDLAVHARYDKGPKKGQLKYDENGEPVYVFSLKKGTKGDDGKKLVDIEARYNPYIHTSRSMINDQFSSAWNRGNLVTVAVEVPESELNSGYRAEKAYLTAGEHEWKSGPISRKLADLGNPRKVILSRYDRPIREVPYEEVAKFYAEQLKGTDIEVPFNTVNESLREALVKEGVKIGAPENSNAGKAAIPAYEEWLKNGGNDGPGGGKIENLTKAQKKERENRRRELVYANYEADSQKMIESGVLLNIQGNPIDKDGRFIVTKLYSALDITKDDFERPIRNIELPSLDDEVDKKVGGNGRNVIIKRSVFLKNNLSHPEIEISDNGQILDNALYRPNELINDKPNSKPNYWIVTKLSNKPVVANIDVDANKSHIELVGWRFISADDIARIERRAIKEGGQVLITNIGAADLSALQDGSVRKGTTSSATDQTNGGEILPGEKSSGTGADGKRNFKVNEEVASDIERIRQRNKEDDARRHALNIRRHELEAEYNEKYPRKNIPEFTTSTGDKVVMTDRGRMVYGPDGTRYTANNFPEKREDALKEYEAATRPEIPFEDYVRENYPEEVAVLKPEAWDQRVVKSPVEMLQEHWSNVEKLADGRKRSDAIRHNNQLIYQSMREALSRVEKAFELQNEREHKDFAEQTAAAMQTGVGAAAQYARGVETDFRRALQTEMTRLAKTLLSGQNGVDQKTVQTLLSQMRDVQNIRTVADARMIVNGVYNAIMESRCRAAAGEIEKSLKVRGKDTSAAGGAKIQNVDEYHAKTMKGIAERMKAKPSADELNAEKGEIQKRLATFDKPVEEMSEIEKQKYNEEIRKMNEIDMYESYQDTVDYWDAEVRRLKEQRKSAKGKGAITAIDESINEKLHSKLKAMGEFTDLVNGFREEGVAGKKSFVEKEEELRRAIDHDIRSDLFGVAPKTTDVKSGIGLGWVSNLNDIMKFLGRRNATGRGRLWERFVGGHMKAIDTRQIGTEQANDKLNAIAKKYGFKSYARMAAKAARMKGATVQFDEAMLDKNGNLEKDEEGEIRYKKVDKKLTVDKLLYIHAVAKMADGRVKLDRMGIDEDVVKEIRDFLDSNEKTKAMRQALDEVQDKLLTELRDKYNVTHRKLFGVGMNEVENYFPIRINQYERNTNEDISMQSDVMPSDMTGAIKKRVSNTHSLDLERGNAFTVVLEHIMEMETWNAFAPFKKEANMLLNNQALKTKLNSMQGIFGKGEALYTHLENNLKIAAEIYRPKKNTKHDVSNWLIRMSKGVIGRAINFNLNTATKQLTSVFAMLGNADVQDVVKTVGTLPHAIYWCSKNLPAYRYRWNSGDMGYAELKRINNPESRAGKVIDWIQDHAAKVGMAPNRMIDMGICAMVARSAYFTKFREYKKAGLSKEDAHNRAIIDAEVAFNESQQSSLGAYMSEIQSRRSVFSVLATTYRNSPMSYGRLVADSITNLARQVARPKDMIAQSEKVWIERGVTPEDAKKAAVRDYLKGYVRNMTTIASVHMMTLAWNRMHDWLYGVLFEDKEQKEENIENAEWLTYADDWLQWIPIIGPMADTVITNIQHVVPLKNAIMRAWKRHDFTALKGALEDINTNTMLMEEFVKAATPIMSGDFTTFTYNGINFLFSLGAGINPALVSDVVMGAFEASQYDPNECKRNWMVAAAILHSPRNSTDQYFVDRLRKALGEEYRENASLTKDGKLSIDSYIEGNPEAEQVMKEFIEYCKTKKLGFMKFGAEVTDEYLDAEAERERAFKEADENGEEITGDMLPPIFDRTASVMKAEDAARKRMQRMMNSRNELHQRRGESADNREATKKY